MPFGRRDIGHAAIPVQMRNLPASSAEEQHRWPVTFHEERRFVNVAQVGVPMLHGEEGRAVEDTEKLHKVAASVLGVGSLTDSKDAAVVPQPTNSHHELD